METLAAEVSIQINAPIEKTWEAVTNPQVLSTWYAPGSTWEIEKLETGEPIWFLHKTGSMLDGEIETLNAPHHFGLRWFAMDPFVIDDNVTHFTLSEEDNGTRVTMEIYDTPDETLSDAERQMQREQLKTGFGMSLENLKAHLDGQPIPHVEDVSLLIVAG
jgi:uncharacterized protein YndB with AHSA1/START domain